MKKIVIEPCFNDVHMEKLHIRNMCDYFSPNIYIIAEGCFPRGPENQMGEDSYKDFVAKYTLNGEGKRSFDFVELKKEVEKCKKEYPNTEFHLIEMEYHAGQHTQEVYFQLFTFFINDLISIEQDDIIMPSEPDMFFTKKHKKVIDKAINKLKRDEGFGSSYLNFFESPKIQKDIRVGRKIAFRYGTGEYYGHIMNNFLYEHVYNKILPMFDFKTFHYEWMRPEPYFTMRVAQVPREWSAEFIKARNIIREKPKNIMERLTKEVKQRHTFRLFDVPLEKEMHPVHIWEHPTFKYYYE